MPNAIAVYCSSSDRIDPEYFAAARALGLALGRRGDTLVYGGGSVGLMGEVARSVHTAGGRVVGVIPEGMKTPEVAYFDSDELIVTQTMRERKAIMDDRADAFIVLPGGFGTLEELLEILTLRILRYCAKPLVILNTAGFYDDLLRLFDRLYEEGFARRKEFDAYAVAQTPEEALRLIDAELARCTSAASRPVPRPG